MEQDRSIGATRARRFVIGVVLMAWYAGLLNPASATPPVLKSFRAEYAVYSGKMQVGKMIRTLNITPERRYQFSSTVEAVGLLAILRKGELEETSEGLLNGEQIQPLIYHYRKKTSKKTKETAIEFNWNAARVSTTSQGQQWKMETKPGMLDKLVYQLALMRDLAPRPAKLQYVIADGGKAKEYAVDLIGNETVEIREKPEATIKLRYQRGNSKHYTLFWCAASYGHLPVRIEYHEDDGQVTTATLISYQ